MVRALVLLILVLLPVTAHAAPVVIAAVAYGASAWATWMGGAWATYAGFIGAAAAIAAQAVIPAGPGNSVQECPTFKDPPSPC